MVGRAAKELKVEDVTDRKRNTAQHPRNRTFTIHTLGEDTDQQGREEGIDRVMNKHDLNAIIAPTGDPAWKTDLINGDHESIWTSSLAAMAGYPNITLPMGNIAGLPVGLSIFGRPWTEATLLEIAYSYEQGTKHRMTPKYINGQN